MSNRFMMSVAAAALIAGTGFAYAQGTGTSPSSSGGSTVQQSGSGGTMSWLHVPSWLHALPSPPNPLGSQPSMPSVDRFCAHSAQQVPNPLCIVRPPPRG